MVRDMKSIIDDEVLEESALAMAQATIQQALNASGMSRADLARKLSRHRSYVTHMLSGGRYLTIKTMARALLACGFEVRFSLTRLAADWRANQRRGKWTRRGRRKA